MKCEYCGNDVDVNAEMCEKCGAPITKNNMVEQPDTVRKVENIQLNNISTNNKKKKNKKIIPIIIGIVVIIVAFITWLLFFSNGGSNLNASASFKTAVNNMHKLDNYTMDLSVNMSMNYNELSGSLEMSANGKIDEKNKTYNMKVNFLGQEMETYGKSDDNKTTVYQYDSYSEKWFSSELEVGGFVANEISETILDSYDVKKVKSDFKGLTKYQVTTDFKQLTKLLLNSEFEDEINLDESMLPDKLTMYVYINSDNYVEKIYIDLLDAMKNIDLGEDDYSFDELSITITFSKFNTTGSVVVPEDVIESASSDDEGVPDKLDESEYNEEDIMYDVVLSSSVYCEDATIDFSNYNGELNDYLDLDKYDIKSITEGIINIDSNCDIVIQKDFIINGRTCTYDDENYESCE